MLCEDCRYAEDGSCDQDCLNEEGECGNYEEFAYCRDCKTKNGCTCDEQYQNYVDRRLW